MMKLWRMKKRIISEPSPSDPGFPELVNTQEGAGSITSFTGGDGVTYWKLEIPGMINGKTGIYTFIKDNKGRINHRFFEISK